MLTMLAAAAIFPAHNTLTADEKAAGWELLFDGESMSRWVNFKSDSVRPGWQVVDGTMKVADPGNAGDIVTKDDFQWFELRLDFKLAKNSNSGVMFHVMNEGRATWHSGPEIQLYDIQTDGVEKAGWLYQLYPGEANTYKSEDWNSMRVLVSKERCATYLNGTQYYEYVLGSDDFNQRLAKSKFSEFPQFAKAGKGRIALQGDHGVVSFRNMKIRRIN